MTVEEYLIKKGIEFEEVNRPSGLNYIAICPFCNGGSKQEKSFAINANTGYFNCLRKNNCGITGTFYQLQERLGDTPTNLKSFVKAQSKVIRQYSLPRTIKLPLNNKYIKYLIKERKINKNIIKKFKLFSGLKGEINIPHIKNNQIINIKHFIPATNNSKKRMWVETNAELCLYNQDNIKGKDLLVITEGEWDCMALTQYGLENVGSLPNGIMSTDWIQRDWDFLKDFKEIYISMDMDKAGQSGVRTIVARLGEWRCKNILLPYKDANECLVNGVSKEEIFKCFKNAEEFTPAELKSAGTFCEEVLDLIRHPEKYRGTETGLPELTEILRGWRKGELTIWTGQNNAGKSTLLNQTCLFLANRKIKCCIASLELRPARYLRWAMCQILGTDEPEKEDVIKAFEWLDKWFYVLDIDDNVHASKIFDLFEYTARRYGVQHFVIDSLMRIRLKGQDENRSQSDFVSDYLAFGKKFQVHCHLVAHPRKQEKDTDKPDKTDVKGTGDITNLADNVLILWRNIEKDNIEEEERDGVDAILYVRKNREFGDLGAVKLYFDPNSRRFRCWSQSNCFY